MGAEWSVVRAQGREDTVCSQPFADVAVTAGTPQPLGLYSGLGRREAALIWKPQRSCSNWSEVFLKGC